ncbi:hypothetical protein [Nocardia puris]|uniref:Uncharacterized protein n=1 Tax=Nocardia puris TaxID=208602 RepID=A0A366DMN6_9NOCA|nr:hypothetical protein [Nocardia puris]RBO91331.1 hypothetical protein DFR74_10433 [Nocardia puris]
MRADQLTVAHEGRVLVTGTGSQRRRATLRTVDLTHSTYVLAIVDDPVRGRTPVVLAPDTEIGIED